MFLLGTMLIGDNCKIQNNVSIYDNITLEEGVFAVPQWCLLTYTTREL